MKGRPITGEEYERMLAIVPRVVEPHQATPLQRFLTGLWWSGLRLAEARRLSWDPVAAVSVFLQPGYHPALKFKAEGHKAGRAELVPCAPEFGEMLEAIPEDQRVGYVFDLPKTEASGRITLDCLGRLISKIGKAAGVVVDEATGKAVTAHDFRRAFGTRWAKRVMPAVLKQLMRHRDIATTLRYYVDSDVEDVAAECWAAYRKDSGESVGESGQKKLVFPVR